MRLGGSPGRPLKAFQGCGTPSPRCLWLAWGWSLLGGLERGVSVAMSAVDLPSVTPHRPSSSASCAWREHHRPATAATPRSRVPPHRLPRLVSAVTSHSLLATSLSPDCSVSLQTSDNSLVQTESSVLSVTLCFCTMRLPEGTGSPGRIRAVATPNKLIHHPSWNPCEPGPRSLSAISLDKRLLSSFSHWVGHST